MTFLSHEVPHAKFHSPLSCARLPAVCEAMIGSESLHDRTITIDSASTGSRTTPEAPSVKEAAEYSLNTLASNSDSFPQGARSFKEFGEPLIPFNDMDFFAPELLSKFEVIDDEYQLRDSIGTAEPRSDEYIDLDIAQSVPVTSSEAGCESRQVSLENQADPSSSIHDILRKLLQNVHHNGLAVEETCTLSMNNFSMDFSPFLAKPTSKGNDLKQNDEIRTDRMISQAYPTSHGSPSQALQHVSLVVREQSSIPMNLNNAIKQKSSQCEGFGLLESEVRANKRSFESAFTSSLQQTKKRKEGTNTQHMIHQVLNEPLSHNINYGMLYNNSEGQCLPHTTSGIDETKVANHVDEQSNDSSVISIDLSSTSLEFSFHGQGNGTGHDNIRHVHDQNVQLSGAGNMKIRKRGELFPENVEYFSNDSRSDSRNAYYEKMEWNQPVRNEASIETDFSPSNKIFSESAVPEASTFECTSIFNECQEFSESDSDMLWTTNSISDPGMAEARDEIVSVREEDHAEKENNISKSSDPEKPSLSGKGELISFSIIPCIQDQNSKKHPEQRRSTDIPKRSKCTTCNETFHSVNAKKRHVQRYHKSGRFECKKCARLLRSEENLVRHMHLHERTEPIPCGDCDLIFAIKAHRTVHRREVHENFEMKLGQQFKTEICSEHKSVENEKEKCNVLFQCDVCEKTFSRRHNLERHVRVQHLGERNYVCMVCKKTFGSISNLKLHVSRMHGNND